MMNRSESIAKLATALVATQTALRPIVKDRANPFFKSNYSTLDAIVNEVRPMLAANGLAVVQSATAIEGPALMVETMLVHTSGEWLSGTAVVPLAKVDPQGAGSALTYGRRYGIAALLSLSTEEDDDGNVATAQHRANTKAAKPVSEAKAAPSKPVPATVRSPVLPFGKKKGVPLSQLPTEELQEIAQWCNGGDRREKFAELIGAIDAEIGQRSAVSMFDLEAV